MKYDLPPITEYVLRRDRRGRWSLIWQPISDFAGILSAIIGVATIAMLVSKQARTSKLIEETGAVFGAVLDAAVKPPEIAELDRREGNAS